MRAFSIAPCPATPDGTLPPFDFGRTVLFNLDSWNVTSSKRLKQYAPEPFQGRLYMLDYMTPKKVSVYLVAVDLSAAEKNKPVEEILRDEKKVWFVPTEFQLTMYRRDYIKASSTIKFSTQMELYYFLLAGYDMLKVLKSGEPLPPPPGGETWYNRTIIKRTNYY